MARKRLADFQSWRTPQNAYGLGGGRVPAFAQHQFRRLLSVSGGSTVLRDDREHRQAHWTVNPLGHPMRLTDNDLQTAVAIL